MKVIIAGGRDVPSERADELVRFAVATWPHDAITHILSGGAKGIDAAAERYAEQRQVPLTVVAADWDRYGRGAGPIRNLRLAEMADGLIAIAGGRGTRDMIKTARARDLLIHEVRA